MMAPPVRRVQHSPVRGEICLALDGLSLGCSHLVLHSDDTDDEHHLGRDCSPPSSSSSAVGSPPVEHPMEPSPSPPPPPPPAPTRTMATTFPAAVALWDDSATLNTYGRAATAPIAVPAVDENRSGGFAPKVPPRSRWRDQQPRARRRDSGSSHSSGSHGNGHGIAPTSIRKRRPPLLVIPTKFEVTLGVAKGLKLSSSSTSSNSSLLELLSSGGAAAAAAAGGAKATACCA